MIVVEALTDDRDLDQDVCRVRTGRSSQPQCKKNTVVMWRSMWRCKIFCRRRLTRIFGQTRCRRQFRSARPNKWHPSQRPSAAGAVSLPPSPPRPDLRPQPPENSFNPVLLATLIAPQHLRPLRFPGALFPPLLLGDAYVSLAGHKAPAAGFLAGASALYAALALRRPRGATARRRWLSVRGGLRAASVAFCAVDVVAGGLAWGMAENDDEGEG
jgi:hypothetical protein